MNQASSVENELPFVSVIMPVYNEASFVERSMRALLSQSYPKQKMEIIIADGMSTDNTREVIKQTGEDAEVQIILIDNPGRIAPTGLNCALERAKGDIIIRVDGHCEIEGDYVSNCVNHLRGKKADGVGGPIETIGETIRASAISLAMSSTFGVGGSAFRTINDREMYVDTVAFPGYTREIIEKAGPFNEELVRNQDDEYNYRIRKLGGRILLSPDIRSRYYSRSTLKSLWRQYFQYGFWKVRVFQLHPRQMSMRQFVPAIFVMSLLISIVFATFSSLGKWALIILVASYLTANLAASLTVGLRKRPSVLPLLSISFGILHISYGLGFLTGLFSFRNRWSK